MCLVCCFIAVVWFQQLDFSFLVHWKNAEKPMQSWIVCHHCHHHLWPVLLHTYQVQESSFFTFNGIIIQLCIHESSFLHVLGISALKLVPLHLAHLKTSGRAEFGLLNIKESNFCLICVFSETDHHTALKIVPLWLVHLKTSVCAEFGPLNTKESDVLAQNVFPQKQIIIELWLVQRGLTEWETVMKKPFQVK